MMARQEDELETRDAGFLQDALMLDWCGKKDLQPEDLDVLRRLGFAARPRERQGWPLFRDHAPGWFPWFLDAQGANDLTRGLRATFATSELVRTRPGFFAPCDETPDLIPTIEFETAIAGNLQPEQVEWRRWLVPPPDEPEAIHPGEDVKLLAQLPARRDLKMEFDIVHTLTPVADERRPYFPRLGLVADQRSGFIFSMEMGGPGTPWSAHVQATWLKAMIEAQARPESLIVRRQEWLSPLRPLADAIGVKLRFQEILPAIDEFCDSFDREVR
jgi:hypothetical protein